MSLCSASRGVRIIDKKKTWIVGRHMDHLAYSTGNPAPDGVSRAGR